jgi:tRNA threonylcarbamoyl adenosine modification protein YeaZ
MKVLGIDTSSQNASIAIIDNEKLIAEYTINTKKTHSQKLMPMIEEMFKASDMKIDEIDLIGICIGPGSFTGLRIGMATAKAIAHVRNIPIVGVNSLESLAFNMNLSKFTIFPIIDAQRNQVYTSGYTWENNKFKSLGDINVISIDELVENIKNGSDEVIFLGEAVNLYKETFENIKNINIAPSSHNISRASSLCQLAINKYNNNIDIHNCYTINPMYIRKSQAEVQYDEKMKRIQKNEQ